MDIHNRLLAAAAALALTFSLAACGFLNTPASSDSGVAEKANKSAASAVLSGLFSAPNKELTAALTTAGNVIGEGVSKNAPQEKNTAIKDNFGNYFTEKALEQFVSDYLSPYQGFAYASNSTLELKNAALTKTNAGYDFSASVQYAKEQSVKSAKVEGDFQFLEDGKITSFRITSDGGLWEWLRSGIQ